MRARNLNRRAAQRELIRRKSPKYHGIAQPFGQNVGENSIKPWTFSGRKAASRKASMLPAETPPTTTESHFCSNSSWAASKEAYQSCQRERPETSVPPASPGSRGQ